MGKTKIDKEILLEFILNNITNHSKDISILTAVKFDISRQTVYRYIRKLIDLEIIEAIGAGNKKEYKLKNKSYKYSLVIDGSWDEETVWESYVRPLISNIPENVLWICHYGVTEMVNNVLEHSEATKLELEIKINALNIEFIIKDDGVGIFSKIQRDFNLTEKRHSILELAKGKLTSDPENHTGEGIFFTSRMFEQFIIISEDIAFVVHVIDVLYPDRKEFLKGTLVEMKINKKSNTDATEVFSRFTPGSGNEDFGFEKTIVPVRLIQYEGDSLISRSQAKRLIARFDRFQEVVLDFNGVTSIGQPFADEVFRVFKNKFPKVHLLQINTNEKIDNMIKHVLANVIE